MTCEAPSGYGKGRGTLTAQSARIAELEHRIEELEAALKLAQAGLADFEPPVRGTLEALRPPVEHHTLGSVLDYYRTIPKD